MAAVTRIDPKTVFTPAEWASLTARSSWRGLALVAHAWLLILGAGALFVVWPNPVTFLVAVLVIGARQLGLGILMHDAAHGALHPDPKVNDFVGDWLCAAPIGSNLATYRKYHLRHHKFTEQPEDPDLVLSKPFPTTRQSLLRKIVRDLTGQTAFKLRVGQFIARTGDAPTDGKTGFLNDTRARFLAVNVVFLAALTAAGLWWAYFALWLLPLATWFQVVTRVRNIGEHACVGKHDDPFHHARTTLANPLERLLIAPYWVHYHAEHHVFMHLPCWKLEEAHRLLMRKGYGPRMEIRRGYGEVLKIAAPA
ncbi:MAG: fatty acid desaturase family protein [Hyphomonadaceae bacterium]|nr:fatty acid desaturase family protein [Hyphomonadaceae bacterium]